MTAPVLPHRRWFPRSFSIRAMLVLTLLVAVPLAWKMNQISRQRRAVAALLAGGQSRLADSGGRMEDVAAIQMHPAWGPEWLHAALGKDLFTDVQSVNLKAYDPSSGITFAGHLPDAEVICIGDLPRVERVSIASAQLTDEGVRGLVRATTITDLTLVGHQGGRSFHPQQGTQVTDRGIELLENLPGLKYLTFIGPAGLTNLGRLRNLEVLEVRLSEAGPEGLEPLFQLSRLKEVMLALSGGPLPSLDRLEQNAREHWPNLQSLSIMRSDNREGTNFNLSWFLSGNKIEFYAPQLTFEDRERIARGFNPQHLTIETGMGDERGAYPPKAPHDPFGDLPAWARGRLDKLQHLQLETKGASLQWDIARTDAVVSQRSTMVPIDLPSMPGLKKLKLCAPALPDRNLERMAAMADLESVLVEFPTSSKMTPGEVDELLERAMRQLKQVRLFELQVGTRSPIGWVRTKDGGVMPSRGPITVYRLPPGIAPKASPPGSD